MGGALTVLYGIILVWRSWLFARAEMYFSARANSQLLLHARRSISPRVQIVSYARLGYYVIDEGSCDESR